MRSEELVDRTCEAWSSGSADERARLIALTLSPDATYSDPKVDRLTVPQLLEHIARMVALRPGARVLRTSRVDVHHDWARFHWHVVMADGSSLPEGIDFIELVEDGTKIGRIVGFFGPLQ